MHGQELCVRVAGAQHVDVAGQILNVGVYAVCSPRYGSAPDPPLVPKNVSLCSQCVISLRHTAVAVSETPMIILHSDAWQPQRAAGATVQGWGRISPHVFRSMSLWSPAPAGNCAPHAAGDKEDVGRPLAGEPREHLPALVECLLRRLHLVLHAAGVQACAGKHTTSFITLELARALQLCRGVLQLLSIGWGLLRAAIWGHQHWHTCAQRETTFGYAQPLAVQLCCLITLAT